MAEVFYSDPSVTLYHGDCLDVLRELPDCSVDAVVTDPPYGLEFMGKDWDSFGRQDVRQRGDGNFSAGDRKHGLVRHGVGGSYGGDTAKAMRAFGDWCEQWAAECLRVLKPGGHLLAFGGTRTWHRLACAVEDAGFEVRDSIAWLYGSGFPKSLDVSKAIDRAAGAERVGLGVLKGAASSNTESLGVFAPEYEATAPATDAARTWQGWGTALKPAFEPIVVGRKPLSGTVAANVLQYGTGALNVDGCRVAHRNEADLRESASKNRHADFGSGPRENRIYGTDSRDRGEGGNYDGSAGRWPANVVLDDSQAAELDRQSGVSRDGVAVNRNRGDERPMSVEGAPRKIGSHEDVTYGGQGGASRFFPTFRYEAKAPTTERPRAGEVAHPTVKPLDLMRWLVRLVTPPGGVVLEPFAGSGTTAEACVLEGFRCIAIEREADYLPLIVQRLSKPLQVGLAIDFGDGGAA